MQHHGLARFPFTVVFKKQKWNRVKKIRRVIQHREIDGTTTKGIDASESRASEGRQKRED